MCLLSYFYEPKLKVAVQILNGCVNFHYPVYLLYNVLLITYIFLSINKNMVSVPMTYTHSTQ